MTIMFLVRVVADAYNLSADNCTSLTRPFHNRASQLFLGMSTDNCANIFGWSER